MRGRVLLDFAGSVQMLMTPLAPRRQSGRSNIEPPTAVLKTNKERKIYALKKTCQHDNRPQAGGLRHRFQNSAMVDRPLDMWRRQASLKVRLSPVICNFSPVSTFGGTSSKGPFYNGKKDTA